MSWKIIDGIESLPRQRTFNPIATQGATTIHHSTGLWLQHKEEIRWYGVDGIRIHAQVLAWYDVPKFNGELTGDRT